MTLNPFIIDCDTGRDDALAIWSALAMDLPLAGVVASYGNTGIENVIDNSARVLALAGRDDIPLLAGATVPSRGHGGFKKIVVPRQAVAGNGLCNIELPKASCALPVAGEELADHIRVLAQKHGKLDYMIIGPATNFAALCDVIGPKIHDLVARVTMMGGKFDALWDQIPGADFNLVCDPFAVRRIFEAGYAIRFVPMNVTWPVLLSLVDIECLLPQSMIGQAVKDVMIAYCKNFAPEPVFRFHDPCVITACLEPSYFQGVNLDIVCDDQSPDHARLVIKEDGFAAAIYQANDDLRSRFLDQILSAVGLQA